MAETTFDFRWRKTPPFLDLHIARLAIMWALVLGKHKKPDWPKAMAAALLLWRKRVSALHALGWRQAAHPARLRNCYPSMFTLKEEPPVHYSCKLNSICLWCYARSLLPLIHRVLAAYVPGESLYMLTHKQRLSALEHPGLVLQYELRQRSDWLREKARSPCFSAAYCAVTCEPQLHGDVPYWKFHGRLLALVRPGELPPPPPEGWKKVSRSVPTPEDFNGYLAAALRYPTGLLRGPADMAQQVLVARDGLRLCGTYGKFRKPRSDVEGP